MLVGGYWLINGLIKMCNEDLENKCGSLGYRLFKHKISWRAAYWECFFTIIKWPLSIIGFSVVLAIYSGGHIFETLIVAVIITIPTSLLQIMPFIRKVELEAEKNYKDD